MESRSPRNPKFSFQTIAIVSLALTLCTQLCLYPSFATDSDMNHYRYLGTYSPIQEPYPPLHGGEFTNKAIPNAPDPLVSYHWSHPVASDGLQTYTLAPMTVRTDSPRSFSGLNTMRNGKCDVTVTGVGFILLDFGVESAAWLEFDSPDLTGKVEMSISEYNEPWPGKTAVPIKHGDTYRLELNPELYEGVRFGWIHVMTYTKPWHITAIRLVCQAKPANYQGSFSCSNPLLTKIWYTGAYTVRLNLLKDYFGAILMDRGDRISWTGDAHTAQAAALAAFGNWDFIRQNLERTANDSNGIESYSLYWVQSLLDYYRYTGDKATFERYIPTVEQKLAHGDSIYANPPIGFYGWDERLGAGFEDANCLEAQNAYRMLFIGTCRYFASEAATIGRTDLQRKYDSLANAKIKQLRSNPHWYDAFGIHADADAINAGFCTPTEQEAIFHREFASRENRLSYSPFNEYFILYALANMNRFPEALRTALDCWGGQIKYGGTTFFEVYRPSWNDILKPNDPVPNCQSGETSLCHPWSAGVTMWLTEEIAGIQPASPGFDTVLLRPHLGRLLTSVSGSVLTPHGVVSDSFNLKTDLYKVTLPPGVTGRIGVPHNERSIERIYCDGQLIWDGIYHPVRGIDGVEDSAYSLYLYGVSSGSYTFSVQYQGALPRPLEEKIVRPFSFLGEDDKTQGDWGGIYGKEGYILFNYGAVSENDAKLPSFIESVTPYRSGNPAENCTWSASTQEKRALSPNPSNGFPRSAGCIYTSSPTMHVDIQAKNDQEYNLELYFLDWDRKGRSSAVELFTLPSLDRATPVTLVSRYEQGKYLVYRCHGSVRIRIDQVREDNAVLCGVFFDPAGSQNGTHKPK
jgi:alpha-L-rhamnosidase